MEKGSFPLLLNLNITLHFEPLYSGLGFLLIKLNFEINWGSKRVCYKWTGIKRAYPLNKNHALLNFKGAVWLSKLKSFSNCFVRSLWNGWEIRLVDLKTKGKGDVKFFCFKLYMCLKVHVIVNDSVIYSLQWTLLLPSKLKSPYWVVKWKSWLIHIYYFHLLVQK